MNENTQRLRPRFARPTRFAVRPALVPNRHGPADLELEALKSRLLAEQTRVARAFVPGDLLRQAADEAASLAWLTPYPLLVLPTLLEELVDTAAARARKQADIRQRSQMLQAA
ncbi:MAG TPA: hypothetical protein VI136_12145 [Verrucomicrobiae bacterium]